MAMERLADEGLCKSIGISNFSVAKSQELIQTCRHPPVVNQVSVHKALQEQGACQLPAASCICSMQSHHTGGHLGHVRLMSAHGHLCIAGRDAPVLAPGQAVPLLQLHGEILSSLHPCCMGLSGASASTRSTAFWCRCCCLKFKGTPAVPVKV